MNNFIRLAKLLTVFLLLGVPWASSAKELEPKQIELALYKNPSCSCCDKWAEHLNNNDFHTEVHISDNLHQLKRELGVSPKMASCHTGVIQHDEQKYIFEGHIPAKFIRQFLENPPKNAVGLSVPAMPVGSPGMEYQNKFMPYKIFQLHKNGQVSVYAEVNTAKEQW